MSISPGSVLLSSLALSAVGFAWLDGPTPSRQLAAPAPSCPLPVGKQVKAIKAFGR